MENIPTEIAKSFNWPDAQKNEDYVDECAGVHVEFAVVVAGV